MYLVIFALVFCIIRLITGHKDKPAKPLTPKDREEIAQLLQHIQQLEQQKALDILLDDLNIRSSRDKIH